MSAALRFPHPLGAAGLRMTAREYFSLGETDTRYELIDGVLVMSPSPTRSHQDVIRSLLRQLEPQADALPGVAIVLDTDIKFADDTVYRPDVAIYLPGRLPDDADYPDIPPDLIIEVISPSSEARDLLTNRTDYARFGVTEYWVVDPGAASVRCFRAARKSRKYARTIVTKTAIDSAAVPGIRIDLGLARRKLGRKRPPRR